MEFICVAPGLPVANPEVATLLGSDRAIHPPP